MKAARRLAQPGFQRRKDAALGAVGIRLIKAAREGATARAPAAANANALTRKARAWHITQLTKLGRRENA